VSFATFVVRKSFVEWSIRDSRQPAKFAQAAKPFNYGNTEVAEEVNLLSVLRASAVRTRMPEDLRSL